MAEVSQRGEAPGWVPVWHRAHDNLPYHTDAEPNKEFIIPLKSPKYSKKMILYSKIYFFYVVIIILSRVYNST